MIHKDDRTKEQKQTHNVLITATDKFMSGWGQASQWLSKCAWACKKEHADKVFDWVSNREEMKYVNINYSGRWHPRNAAHVHIYVVEDNHPALN